MELKLNPLKEKINVNPEDKTEVTLVEFWKMFLRMLQFRADVLTDREIDLMAYIMSNKQEDFISEQKIAKPNYHALIKRLNEKGYLLEGSVHPKLSTIQNFINTGRHDVTFILPFKIKEQQ